MTEIELFYKRSEFKYNNARILFSQPLEANLNSQQIEELEKII